MNVVNPFPSPGSDQQVSVTLDVVDGVKVRAQMAVITSLSSLAETLKKIRTAAITELLDTTKSDNKIISDYNEQVRKAISEEKKD